MGILLNLLYLFAILLLSPWLVWRSFRTGRYREGWGARWLGRLEPNASKQPAIWFHAVSVGEVQLLRNIVRPLYQRYPDFHLVVTTTTRTGYALAKELFPEFSVQYAPMDFTWAVRNAMRRLQPQMIVLIELELWPNWIHIASQLGADVVLVNARLSEKSYRGYQKLRWLMKSSLRQIRWFGTQDQTYAERLVALGADPLRVVVTGSMKFDGTESDRSHPEIMKRRVQARLSDDSIVLVCGSTQEPEEEMAIHAFKILRPRYPTLRLILVPRHPERFESVAEQIAANNLRGIRRSLMNDAAVDADWEVLLVDTIGELRWFWGLADLGFVGGSFGNRGGQNMLEPAAFGVCISFGPNTWNFRDIVEQLLGARGATVLNDPSEFIPWLKHMIEHPEERRCMGDRASDFVARHRGAAERTISALCEIIDGNARAI